MQSSPFFTPFAHSFKTDFSVACQCFDSRKFHVIFVHRRNKKAKTYCFDKSIALQGAGKWFSI